MVASVSASAPIQFTGITFEQFLKDYDGQHAEWLPDGSVELVVGNNVDHNALLGLLHTLLSDYLERTDMGRVILAGYVMKSSSTGAGREPDLLVIFKPHLDRIRQTYLDGVADIAVEIVSPESVERDYGTKFGEYETVGVPEYWLFDPERDAALIYALHDTEHGRRYKLRPFDTHGRLTSGLLPGFALDPAILWAEPLPGFSAIGRLVDAMTANN